MEAMADVQRGGMLNMPPSSSPLLIAARERFVFSKLPLSLLNACLHQRLCSNLNGFHFRRRWEPRGFEILSCRGLRSLPECMPDVITLVVHLCGDSAESLLREVRALRFLRIQLHLSAGGPREQRG